MKALLKFTIFAFMLSLSSFFCSDDGGGSPASETEPENAAPTVSITSDYDTIFTYDSRRPMTALSVTASDSDGTVESYNYSIVSDTSNGYLTGSDTATGKYYHSGSKTGQATISVTVTDDKGAESTAEVSIDIWDTSVFKISDTEGGFTGAMDGGDNFGRSVANIGDLNSDGINDLAVGASKDDDGGSDRGAVWILFLKADCSVKSYQKISDTEGGFTGALDNVDNFGNSVANIGDLDGDGINDIAVGAYQDDDGGSDRGAVWILFLNADGTVKDHQKISDSEGNFTGTLDDDDYFGGSIANIGDLDGDYINDIAVGAYRDDDGGDARGAVWILFLNADGTVKDHQKISDTEGDFLGTLVNGDYFGCSIANIGDLNGDDVTDIAIGAYLDSSSIGAVWILFLNTDGTVKSYNKISDSAFYFLDILDNADFFGYSTANIGDIDKDGINDIAVGAYGDDDGGMGSGAVWILFLKDDGTVKNYQKISGMEGNFTGILDTDDKFGSSVTNYGDIDGDGINDIAVGASEDEDGGSYRGAVWLMLLDSDGSVFDIE